MKNLKYRINKINLAQIPSFQYLAAFERAAFHNSFTKAAQDLGRSTSAVSRAISELEERFGCVLFERLGKEVRLTDTGREYLSDVRQALQILERSGEGIVEKKNRKLIRLHTQPMIAKELILPNVPEFRKRYPGYDLKIEISRDNIDWSLSDIDIELRFREIRNSRLHVYEIGKIGLAPGCSPKLIKGINGLKSIHDLENVTVLSDDLRPDGWDRWLKAVGYPELELKNRLNLSDFLAILGMTLNGDGVPLLPYPFVTRYPCYGTDIILPFGSSNLDYIQYYLVCRQERRHEKKIEVAIKWFHELFERAEDECAS